MYHTRRAISMVLLFLLLYLNLPEVDANDRVDFKTAVPGSAKEQKIDSGLQKMIQDYSQKEVNVEDRNRVKVIVELDNSDNSLADLFFSLDVIVESVFHNNIQISIPIRNIPLLAQKPSVRYLRYPVYPTIFEVISEGVAITRADLLHDQGMTGEGVKIAVIDVGFDISNPEISPNIAEVKSFRFDGDITGSDDIDRRHGTAVVEILIDAAPQARLYLYNFDTDIEFLNAVDYVIASGVDILSISIGFVNVGPYDGTSYIAEAIDKAWQNGITVFAAAGNQALSHWSGTFNDEDNDDINEFIPGDETNEIQVAAGSWIRLYLSWNQWPYSNQDYDLYLYDGELNLVAYSASPQSGIQPPTERIVFFSPNQDTYRVVIGRSQASGNVKFDLFSFDQPLERFVVEGSITSPADAKGCITVGASFYIDDQIESFSSQGPTADGRTKPDLTGPDGVTTTAFGSKSFYGTSASTPYAAGIAALLKGKKDALTPSQIKEILEKTALDRGSQGKDNVYGAGRVDAYTAALEIGGIINQVSLQVFSSTQEFQYPDLPPFNLIARVLTTYQKNGISIIENQTTPFFIKADQGTTARLTVETLPQGYEWVEWDNYGFGRTPSTSLDVGMDDDRTAVAYFQEPGENFTHVYLTLHSHPDEFQYPQEPATELSTDLKIRYRVNNTWRSELHTIGPDTVNFTIDKDTSTSVEIIKIPQDYYWHEWDEYGKGRTSTTNLTISMNEDKILIAYFTQKQRIEGDFALTAQPQTQYFVPGQTINYTLTISAIDQFSEEVTIQVINPPPSTDITIEPATLKPPGKVILAIRTSPNTPSPFTLHVNAVAGEKSHNLTLTLTAYTIPGFDHKAILIGLILGMLILAKRKEIYPICS